VNENGQAEEEDRKLDDFETIMISHHKKSNAGSLVLNVHLNDIRLEVEENKNELQHSINSNQNL